MATEQFKRIATIDRESIDEEARTISLSFSSETPVQDSWYGPPSVLLHEKKAANFKPLRDIGSVLVNHDHNRIIGAPIEVTLDETDRKGRAVIRFDDDEDGEWAFQKVRSGSLRGVSVRYSASVYQELGDKDEWKSPSGRTFKGPLRVATRWEPREISLTPIPADVEVGVGRGGAVVPLIGETIPVGNITFATGSAGNIWSVSNVPGLRFMVGDDQVEDTPGGDKSMVISQEIREALEAKGLKKDATDEEALKFLTELRATEPKTPGTSTPSADEVRKAERQRIAELQVIATASRQKDSETFLTKWISDGWTPEQARAEMFDVMAKREPPVTRPSVTIDLDERDKRRLAYDAAICRRLQRSYGRLSTIKPDDDKAGADLPADISIVEIARSYIGPTARGMTKDQVIRSVLSHGTSDFPALLENIANKSLNLGFERARVTYRGWTTRGTLPDFKEASRVKASEAPEFTETPELMPVAETQISDAKEPYQIKTYASKLGISRQALVNDDLGALDRASKWGDASARTVNTLVYNQFNSPPTMNEDSKALFATDHTSGSNLAGSGAVISLTTLNAARLAMRKQAGLQSAPLNIVPAYLIVPPDIEGTALSFTEDRPIPTTASAAHPRWIASLVPIVDPALTSATAWFMAADPNQIDTVMVAWLNGQESPTIESDQSTGALGTFWIVYIDVAVRAVEHRGLYKNPGA